MKTAHNTDWEGLYGESWSGVISPESFAHPAKFSRGLIRHIYQHLFDEGWLALGNVVLDPFGGVALGAWPALQMGLHWVGVELEQPFCDLGQGCDCTGISRADWVRFFGRWEKARYLDGRYWCPECLANAKVVIEHNGQLSMFDAPLTTSYVRNSGQIPYTGPHRYHGNIERWEGTISRNGASAVLLQGDSRQLSQVVGEAGAVVGSPPWAESLGSMDMDFVKNRLTTGPTGSTKLRGSTGARSDGQDYGSHPANLGNMPPGTAPGVDGVIASPPYAGSVNQSQAANDGQARIGRKREAGIDVSRPVNIGGPNSVLNRDQCYGTSPGQLAAMPPGQVADAVVGSPPWEESLDRGVVNKEARVKEARKMGISNAEHISPIDMENVGLRTQPDYGNTAGQLGQESGTTFWSAARAIVEQCHQVLKPGAVAVWVVKAFVRKGERVDFPGQWRQLCESCGFETVHVHRAWLIEDRGNVRALFDFEIENENGKVVVEAGHVMHRKGKKELKDAQLKRCSFFRRLAERKGSPRIDYEVVLCTIKR